MKLQKHLHTYWHSLVSKEINGLKAVIFHMSQAIPLVPSIRKDIKADLASCQAGRGNAEAEGHKEANDRSPKIGVIYSRPQLDRQGGIVAPLFVTLLREGF